MARTRIEYGGRWDDQVVEQELKISPLAVPPVDAPVLTVDGLVEPDASAWLAQVHARTSGTQTARSYAESLRQFAAFMLQRNTSLRGARREHVVEYVRYRTIEEPTRVSGMTWQRDRTTIKQFYEWLRETYGIDLPFTLDILPTERGPVTSMREGRGIPTASASGTPLEPPQIQELLAAAWGIRPNARLPDDSRTSARDAAFISLGLACGARADTLTHLTVYELPDPIRPGDVVEMYLPGAVSKSRREVRLPAFRRHLQPVYDYLSGARRLLLQAWMPHNPIRVAAPPEPGSREIKDVHGNRYRFNEMTVDQRRRLLTPAGEPAMLFLSVRDGAPLSYHGTKEITADISRIAEENARTTGRFFPHVHTHDLRHTYATHLAALFMLGIATSPHRDMHGRPHRVDVRSAVRMASIGLGHVSEATTALYIQQVGLMCLRYSVDEFLGPN
ncbi:site-specific integrase [Nesterenkonia sp. CF4.4]|uniref:site-specific integrase n=1 Tax=Nesterenkonia sp. CF4.4 TaxID=3373079 RepID=UPI003EE5E0D3